MNPEQLWARTKAETGKLALRAAYQIEIEDPANHLGEVKTFLEQGGNLIMFGNHIAFDDPVVEVLFYERFLNPQGKRHLILPASHWHTDPANNAGFAQAAEAAHMLFDAEIFRIIQKYMVDDPKYGGYTTQQATDNNYNFLLRLRELQRLKTPTDLLIYPEGHRSEDGALQQTEDGMTVAGFILKPTVYLPLALYYPDGYERDHLNTRLKKRTPHIALGAPVFQTGKEQFMLGGNGIQIPKENQMSFMMRHLAQTLPPPMRGIYA